MNNERFKSSLSLSIKACFVSLNIFVSEHAKIILSNILIEYLKPLQKDGNFTAKFKIYSP